MEKHTIMAEWKDGIHFESNAPGGLLPLDGAEESGGQGKGLRPKALMLSAIAGCTGIDVVMVLNKMRVPYQTFHVEVNGELTDEHPKMYHAVHIIYHFKAENPDMEKFTKAVTLSFEKYCGVIAMFKKFATVTMEIKMNV